MTTFSCRPVSGSDESRGSSSSTSSSGSGKNSASWYGAHGRWTLMTWNPPECQVVSTILRVWVGLWAEYDVRGGLKSSHVDSKFSGSRYSASTVGCCGSEMSIIRAQPHGQPCAEPVADPYTSSETYAQSFSNSLMALCAPGPGQTGRLPFSVIRRGSGLGAPS